MRRRGSPLRAPLPDDALEQPSFEERAVFLLRLRERGIRDLTVLRALEAVPRGTFVVRMRVTLRGGGSGTVGRDWAREAACPAREIEGGNRVVRGHGRTGRDPGHERRNVAQRD